MRFIAEGPQDLLRIGYEAGFGERNAQGFGMVRVC
jgi:CRISPR-associated endoribonuclease Cas6